MKSFRKTSFSVYPADGTRCRGAYYPGDTGVVGIHIHGFRSSVAHRKARFFLDHALARGHSWANFDLPCHGRSEGAFRKFRVSNALDALLAVIRQFRGAPVVLLGSSIGAWLAMLAARELSGSKTASIAGAVLIAPAFDFFSQYHKDEPALMREWQRMRVRAFTDRYDGARYELDYAVVTDAERHNLLERPARHNFPVRIFHGDRDEVAPLALSHRFADTADGEVEVQVIRGGDHALAEHLPLIAEQVDGLFEMMRGRNAA